jgi:hypothetical protein
VEAQVFLAVNDPNAVDFNMFDYKGVIGDHAQAASLPTGTAIPVVFRGSNTAAAIKTRRSARPRKRPGACALSARMYTLVRSTSDAINGEHDGHDVRPLVRSEAC